jgi:phosphoglycerol transferase MdoB-like AlkP superfamily enzyme
MWKNRVGPLYPFIVSVAGVLVFLSFARAIHTWLYFDHIVAAKQLWTIFVNGVRMDLVICVYLFALPVLIFTTLHTYFNSGTSRVKSGLIYWMLGAFLVLVFMEAVTPLYILEYGSRPERKFFEYLGHPKEVLTMLSGTYGFTAMMIFAGLAIITPVLLHLLKRIFAQPIRWTPKQYLVLMPVVLIILFICGRSSFDHRAINPSMTAFTDDVLLNNLPMNSLYSVLYAAYRVKDEEDASRMYGKLTDDEVDHYVYDDHPTRGHKSKPISNELLPFTNNKNVVIILEESLGARFVERLGGQALTPNLNKLADEGWWFTNLYATGTRSVRGIEAVATGFLPTPGRSVVKLSSSQSNFFTLASLLKDYHYTSRFYYGGSAHFDNMQGFVLGNGFNEVVDQNDYIRPTYSGSWGVSDDDVFTRIHHDLENGNNTPQLLVMLTTSNHTPFDFPVTPEDQYTKPLKSRNNAIRYADKALGKFIDQAKQSRYWDNTIFLIVADHDLRVADFITAIDSSDKSKTNKIFPVEGFHIPGLILGGGITPKVTNSIVSQIDLPTTILGLLGINCDHPMLGVDLTQVDSHYEGRAIMQFADYQAYLDGQDLVVLRPSLEPLTGRYINQLFSQQPVRKSLKNKALAHALWASKTYKEQSYHN